ncbi:MAG: DUF4340 domain-containing protein [Planctomycetes bacterium]|nr:DUF4340 domain-containing protein [Planctomycetota bacterium]
MTEEAKTTPGETTAARFTPDEVIAKQRNRQLMVVSAIIVVLAILVWVTRATKTVEEPLKEVTLVGGTTQDPAFHKEDIKRIQVWVGKDGAKLELNRDGDDWRVPSRFNAPADKADVDSLITRIFDSARLNRASTTTTTQFISYSLNDEDAVHLRLESDKGAELLHVMVGHADGATRDFVRLAGADAPEGIFELTGLGGQFDTLYGALNLDSSGKPDAKRWVSTKAFEPLPFEAVVQEFTVKDGERSMVFQRKPGSDPAAEEWELVSPRKGDAEGQSVRAITDALQNYHAGDIAGRAEDAAKFELVSPGKEVTIKYTVGEKMTTAHLYFGTKNADGDIAVMLKTANTGEFIYWAGEYVLSRIFRPTTEFMRKVRLNLIPDGVTPDSLTVQDGDSNVALEREAVGAVSNWKMTAPLAMEVDRVKVSNLQTTLNTMQGYPDDGTFDRAALEVGPGFSRRWVTAVYPAKTAGGSDEDGDDTPDNPEAEKPGDEKPADEKPAEEPTKPEVPKVKTATLYFGKTQQGEIPVLRVIDGAEQLYWVKADAISALFVPAGDYLKLTDVSLAKTGQKPSTIRVANGDAVLQLSYSADAQGQMQWRIQQPWDEMADQGSADGLNRALQMLRGAKLAEALDKTKYKLGEGVSTQQVDLQLKEGEELKGTTLYVGEKMQGLRTGLIVRTDGTEEYWLFPAAQLFELFVSPADFKVMGAFEGKVRHILVTWKGKAQGLVPKDPERTEEQAWELANDILSRAKAGEDFVELQKQYNEDSDATHVYDVSPTAGLVKPFLRLASELKVDEVGIVESQFGIHVIKRIE